MNYIKNMKVFQVLILCGALSALSYILHQIVGAMLWPEYNWLSMAVSELSTTTAPNQNVISFFLAIYGWCYVAFTIFFMIILWDKTHRLAKFGSIFLFLSAIISKVGYGLFPFNGEVAGFTVNNIAHIIITALIVISTIAAGFLLAFGFMKTPKLKSLGKFMLFCAIIFTISGGLAGGMIANHHPLGGLIQRINSGTLQLYVFVLSLYFYKYDL